MDICVFCGSKSGTNSNYRTAAEQLGTLMAEQGHRLIYGGGSVGLMGAIADQVLKQGGEVIGVLPKMLATKELKHTGVTQMHLTENMHDRKALMAEQADAFIAMPGGYGTFEELFEILTWAQLGIHRKSIGVLDTNGYYQPLLQMIEHAISAGFIKPEHRQLLVAAADPATLLEQLSEHEMPQVKQWLSEEET